jgi:hypothetical protein
MVKMVQRRSKKVAVVKDCWPSGWEARCDAIAHHGVPALIKRASIVDDFVSVELEIDDAVLPRPASMRPFDLHLTLGYASDYHIEIVTEAVKRINERWAGQWLPLRIKRWTSGGTIELAWDDMLAQDEDVWWLHSRGYYGNGRHTRVRQLHISL